ncbi:MAG: glycosyltransferase family 9 protein [bacterium]
MQVDLSKIKKVLIIRHRAIGDIILVTPFIRALKKAMPNVQVDMVIEPMGIEVLQGNPYINKAIIFEKNKFSKAPFWIKIKETFKFYKQLMDSKYDVVFDLWGNLRTALMCFFTGAKYRVGFNFRVRKYFYNIVVKPDGPPKYNVYYHMDLLKAIGIKDDGQQTDFYVMASDKKFAENFYESIGKRADDIVVGLNPAGSWITKRWPEYKYAQLADEIVKVYKNVKIVIVWGPKEKFMAEKIYTLMKEVKKDVFLAPETTLKQLGALLLCMNVFVSNDGAPNHLAIALNVPSLTVFGPTNYKSWIPAGSLRHAEIHSEIKCAPCDRMACPTNIECMNDIDAHAVFEVMDKLLKQTK